jgi:hypothetical protein
MTRSEKIQTAIRNIQRDARCLPFKQNKPSQKSWNAMLALFTAEDAEIIVSTLAERGDRLGEKCDWIVTQITKLAKQAPSTVTKSGFSGGDGYTVTNAIEASELWLAINSTDEPAPETVSEATSTSTSTSAAQSLISALCEDWGMQELELRQALILGGSLADGLTRKERQLLAEYWELNESQLS